ncbi:MAG: methionine synthase [Myxococcota bacterium]
MKINIENPATYKAFPARKKFYYRAGYKAKQISNPELAAKFTAVYKTGTRLVQPVICWTTIPVVQAVDLIPASFKGVKQVTLFASTIGKEIDGEISRLHHSNQPLEAMLLDAWGSESVEELNQCFDQKLRREKGRGTRRFSPGYQDLPLAANNLILEFLDFSLVEANKKGILTPVKSIICMIGWYNEQK